MGRIKARFIRRRLDKSEVVEMAEYETLDICLMDMKLLQDVPGCRCLDIWNGPIHMKGWELQNVIKSYTGQMRY